MERPVEPSPKTPGGCGGLRRARKIFHICLAWRGTCRCRDVKEAEWDRRICAARFAKSVRVGGGFWSTLECTSCHGEQIIILLYIAGMLKATCGNSHISIGDKECQAALPRPPHSLLTEDGLGVRFRCNRVYAVFGRSGTLVEDPSALRSRRE